MTPARADCEDCPWSDDFDSLLEASEDAEDHERKERHDVSIERVATDGGEEVPGVRVLSCPECSYEISEESDLETDRCPGCDVPLVIDADRVAHECPDVDVDYVVSNRGRECSHCEDVPMVAVSDGGIESGYYVVDEVAGAVLDGPHALHAQAMAALADQDGDHLVVASEAHLEMLLEQGDDLDFSPIDGGREPELVTDGGEVIEDVDDRADAIEAELLDRLDGPEDTLVVRGGRVAEALGMDTAGFTTGLRKLREREDAALDIERWRSDNPGSPWRVEHAEPELVADGGELHAWIVTCQHDERTVVDDDQEAALLEELGIYDVSIASWTVVARAAPEPDVVTDGGQATSADVEAAVGGDDVDAILRFAEEWRHPILAGRKTATVRHDDAEGIVAGDVVDLLTEDGTLIDTVEVSATAECEAIEAYDVLEAVGARYPAPSAPALVAGVNEHYCTTIRPTTPVRVVVWDPTEVVDGA